MSHGHGDGHHDGFDGGGHHGGFDGHYGGHGSGFGHYMDQQLGYGDDLGHGYGDGGYYGQFVDPHSASCCHYSESDGSMPVGDSGVVTKADSVEVHVISHACCEVKYIVSELLDSCDLLTYQLSLPREDTISNSILPDDPWGRHCKRLKLPPGWYPRATGKTRLWRDFYTVGKRPGFWIFKKELERLPDSRTYIEVKCVTRCYVESGDFQTDLVIRVHSLPRFNVNHNSWHTDYYGFKRHMEAAGQLAAQLQSRLLNKYPPRPEAEEIRAYRRAKCQCRQNPQPAQSNDNGAAEEPPVPASSSNSSTSGANIDGLFPPEPDGPDIAAGSAPSGGGSSDSGSAGDDD